MSRSAMTLLEVMAGAVLMAMASGALFGAIRLHARSASDHRGEFDRLAAIPPARLAHPDGLGAVRIEGPGTDSARSIETGPRVRWLVIRDAEGGSTACVRLIAGETDAP